MPRPAVEPPHSSAPPRSNSSVDGLGDAPFLACTPPIGLRRPSSETILRFYHSPDTHTHRGHRRHRILRPHICDAIITYQYGSSNCAKGVMRYRIQLERLPSRCMEGLLSRQNGVNRHAETACQLHAREVLHGFRERYEHFRKSRAAEWNTRISGDSRMDWFRVAGNPVDYRYSMPVNIQRGAYNANCC